MIRKTIVLYMFVFVSASCSTFQISQNTIYLAGDSTMSIKDADKKPETGWGEKLPEFFIDKVMIENHAKNGRSTNSFIAEERWDSILYKLIPNDVVFIQFGHNDSKKKSKRYASPENYENNLKNMVLDVLAKGAHPVLCTPVVRRRFDENGEFYDTHGEYPEVVRKLAKRMTISMIDMHQSSEKLVREYGEERSKALFLFLEKGNKNYPDGLQDNTHFSEQGAYEMARIAVRGIKNSKEIGLSKIVIDKD